MFVLNDDLSIYATRGDIVFFSVSAEQNGKTYTFKAGDVMRVKVFGKKNAKHVVLQKDFPIVDDCTEVEIVLDETDTKFGGIINKPTDYWYEVELNPLSDPQTIIGYDEDGPKVFRLMPEGADVPEDEPNIKPEDIPFIDSELDITSPRPVENQAAARAILQLQVAVAKINGLADETKARFDNLIAEDDKIVNKPLEYMSYISEETRSKVSAHIESDGVMATIKVNWREANQLYGGSGQDYFVIPPECRPIDMGVIHTADGLEYTVRYDNVSNRYLLYIGATSDVLTAPESAGVVTIPYRLAEHELKDLRAGANGVTYETAGDAVRAQFNEIKTELEAVNAAIKQIADAIGIEVG